MKGCLKALTAQGGGAALSRYARHVQALRDEYSLLALPLELWEEPE